MGEAARWQRITKQGMQAGRSNSALLHMSRARAAVLARGAAACAWALSRCRIGRPRPPTRARGSGSSSRGPGARDRAGTGGDVRAQGAAGPRGAYNE